ncbi:MAG TPA: UMP kinase [Candidatus Limnocylindrales bacterium]|nr:UMP kinase [Candidatus Limnocylindrales bacterium]
MTDLSPAHARFDAAAPQPAFKRIVLKLSGEALSGEDGFGIDPEQAEFIARKVQQIVALGVQVALIIGGGNLWRGSTGVERGMEQATADHMGIIATVMNGLALQDALQRQGVITRVQTAIQMNQIAEPYIRLRAIRHLEKGRVVIITGGTGNPFFTTDTAAALRAVEIGADIVIKATKVNGIYTADPKKDPSATRYPRLSYSKVMADRLNVMDMTAIALCQEHNLPIMVVNFWNNDDLYRAVLGDESVGTLIRETMD